MYNLINKIQQDYNNLTDMQKLVADYTLSNYSKIPFITITTMAQEIGVSDTTIVNFCSIFGYQSFSKFKKIFTDHVQSELAIYDNFDKRIQTVDKDNIISQIIDAEKINIDTTLNRTLNKDNIKVMLEMLDSSSTIYVCGMRSSSILMDYMVQNLRVQGYRSEKITLSNHFVDRLCMIDKNDLFINFSFSRYTKLSVQALEFISNKNIPTISFTDSVLSPTYRLSNIAFICETKSYGHQASYAGVLALLNAISIKTALRHEKRIRKSIDELEIAFKHFTTFTDNDI